MESIIPLASTGAVEDTTAAEAELGKLPEWDLSDLYGAPDSPELEADLTAAAERAKDFRARFEGHLAGLAGAALAAAIQDYEAIQEVLGRVMSYAQLVHSGDMSDPEAGRFYQTMQERVTVISTDLLFFTLELNRLEEAGLEARLADPALARYRPWLRDLRAFRPHQLSDELEALLHEKSVAGRAAWVRLFDETMADLRFPLDGKELTSAEVLHKLTDRDGAVRDLRPQPQPPVKVPEKQICSFGWPWRSPGAPGRRYMMHAGSSRERHRYRAADQALRKAHRY